jgi:tRNA-specific 2-thiouridylase
MSKLSKQPERDAKKVWVGMSGGVDSSVSAYLLKKQDYDVTGVFIKVWQPDDTDCNWKEERRDAMRVCAVLGIPFKTLDLSTEYKKQVVDYMIMEYAHGRTPNPDIMCNRHIKFGGFLELARKSGVDYVATGHYANALQIGDRFVLSEGVDKNKDQSYFLWTLNNNDLKNVLFPIGHLEKDQVRKIAKEAGLPVFDKKDSQGICFIGHVDMKDFLKKYIRTMKGQVLDVDGNVIGEHSGSILYTIGERVGVDIFKQNKNPNDAPYYVLSKDLDNNTITVTHDNLLEINNLESKNSAEIILKNVNINTDRPDLKNITVRVRYRQVKHPCDATLVSSLKSSESSSPSANSLLKIKFKTPQVIAPGQSVVLYDGNICLGGGIIQ